jgi:hypothetical protein
MIIHPDMGIELPDGTRLSARVWMPENAGPLPAILEYLPYRKSDGTAMRDHGMHLHFARAGYVCLRVDRRGCGESEGLFDDEYSEEELNDGVDIINWIAAQDWCDGNVGIQGISWGGFNGVQLAARAPEALKAVITIGTTVDRYHDDIHYKGGIQLGENIGWAATVMSWFSMPPDPGLVGDNRWREIWLDRLENTPFLADIWMRHGARDNYWKHGSICEEYSAVKAPVLVMGGLQDGYRNAMAAMVENLPGTVKGVAGPWSHKYPNISTIGPSIDYLGEALRWWDHWLKGKETGVENDPVYRAYVMDSIAPDSAQDFRPGRWVAQKNAVDEGISREVLPLGNCSLGRAEAFEVMTRTNLACGRGCGEFFPMGAWPGELPGDQGYDDSISACFDAPPQSEARDILGAPKLRLRLASSAARAQMIVRLCDLRPDGSSALISLGLLNLRHRDGFDQARDLVPGEVFEVELTLDQAAYNLPEGHRLRLAISNSYWPYCWPEANDFTLTLSAGELSVPWRAVTPGDEITFAPPVAMEMRKYRTLDDGSSSKEWEVDPATGHIVMRVENDTGRVEDLENGLITQNALVETWEITKGDPASAKVEIKESRSLGRGGWEVSSTVTTKMRGEVDAFVIEQRLTAFEGAEKLFDKTWQDRIAR